MTGNRTNRASRWLMATALATVLTAPQISLAQHTVEDPSALAMAADLVIARPVGLVALVAGSALYLVSLPFALAGGNAKQTGKTLVVGPAMTTFVRCLGCSRLGYQHDMQPE